MKRQDVEDWAKVTETVTPLGEAIDPTKAPLHVRLPVGRGRDTIDLHGLVLKDAHTALMVFLRDTKRKTVTVITGRSGEIKREFPHWVSDHPKVKTIRELPNRGSFEVSLLTVRRPTQ